MKVGKIATITAVAVFAIFIVIAIVMPHANAGASFGWKDQVFTGVLGAIIAGGLHLPARPRLRADTDVVRTRSFLGNWRTIPWDVA